MICKAKWFLVGLLWLLLWSTSACDGEEDWREYNTAGIKAYQQGDYVDAERLLSAALEEAEEFGVEDLRFATSLNNLAGRAGRPISRTGSISKPRTPLSNTPSTIRHLPFLARP